VWATIGEKRVQKRGVGRKRGLGGKPNEGRTNTGGDKKRKGDFTEANSSVGGKAEPGVGKGGGGGGVC